MVFLECSHKENIILFVFVPSVHKRIAWYTLMPAVLSCIGYVYRDREIEQIEHRCVLWHGEGGHGI